jgi:hypothetical protein
VQDKTLSDDADGFLSLVRSSLPLPRALIHNLRSVNAKQQSAWKEPHLLIL